MRLEIHNLENDPIIIEISKLNKTKILLENGVINLLFLRNITLFSPNDKLEIIDSVYGIYHIESVRKLIDEKIIQPDDLIKLYSKDLYCLLKEINWVDNVSDHLRKTCQNILMLYEKQPHIVKTLVEIKAVDFYYLEQLFRKFTDINDAEDHIQYLNEIYHLPHIRDLVVGKVVTWEEVYSIFKRFDDYVLSQKFDRKDFSNFEPSLDFAQLLKIFQHGIIQNLILNGFMEPKYLFTNFFSHIGGFKLKSNTEAQIKELTNFYDLAKPLITAGVISIYYCKSKLMDLSVLSQTLESLSDVFFNVPQTKTLIKKNIISAADISRTYIYKSQFDSLAHVELMGIIKMIDKINFTPQAIQYWQKLKSAGVVTLKGMSDLYDGYETYHKNKELSNDEISLNFSIMIEQYLKDLNQIYFLPQVQELLKAKIILLTDVYSKYCLTAEQGRLGDANQICRDFQLQWCTPEVQNKLEEIADKETFIAGAVQALYPPMSLGIAREIGFFISGKDATAVMRASLTVHNEAKNIHRGESKKRKLAKQKEMQDVEIQIKNFKM